MNFINSFNVQGEPCVMGYNKLVVPFVEMQGVKIPAILGVLVEFLNSDNETDLCTKEEFLQFFGGTLPETSGLYLLVENLEDSSGFTLKWNESLLAEKFLGPQLDVSWKVYTISCEDIMATSLYAYAAGEDISKLVLLSTLGFTIVDSGDQIGLCIGLQL